jgi:predicted ArsR family transcriptional regulator
MREDAFFQTTRGRVLESLKRRGGSTAAELAAEHGLTVNAVRQHLSRLEGEGLIAEGRTRRGRTKPSVVYSVTHAGERLFPQRYDVLLNAVLHELQLEDGDDRVTALFKRIGERSARKYAGRFEGKALPERVDEVTKILREQGVVADCEPKDGGFVIREHNCPFKETAGAHPQVCTVVHTLMNEVLPSKPDQRSSIARGDAVCEFHIPAGAAASGTDKSGETYGLS